MAQGTPLTISPMALRWRKVASRDIIKPPDKATVLAITNIVYHCDMPVLRNPKHEAFCQHIATSPKTRWPQGRCYTEAGFKTAARSADACAARLLTRANIQARIAELTEPTVRKTRATVDTLARQFDEVFEGAMGSAQFGAAGSAAAAKAKLLGFMRERIEAGGVGDFDGLNTEEQVIDHLIERLGHGDPAAAIAWFDELRDLIEQRAAQAARPAIPVAKERAVPKAKAGRTQSQHALAIFRPGRS